MIELGARPLVVTATTCDLTPIGRANIDNLARYATTIEISPNKEVRKKLNRLGLRLVGDCSWPEHLSINCAPFKVAKAFGIPLLFYGEAPLNQYGSPPGLDEQRVMTKRWITEFGGHLGLRPSDMVGQDGITTMDMEDYMLSDCDGVTAYWLGQFIPWDSNRNAKVSANAGMRQELPCSANWWIAENLDNSQTGAHDFLCYMKYGFGRACAQVSVDIRVGALTREDGLEIVRQRDGIFPTIYAGIDFHLMLSRMGMHEMEFHALVNQFTNRELFSHIRYHRAYLKEFA